MSGSASNPTVSPTPSEGTGTRSSGREARRGHRNFDTATTRTRKAALWGSVEGDPRRRVRSRIGSVLRFGVSDLLFRSDLLMFDRGTGSLWAKLSARTVTGTASGERLKLVRSRPVSWEKWKSLHPSTTVLTRETDHARDYSRMPYGGYEESRRTFFSSSMDARFRPKMRAVDLRLPDGRARADPRSVVEAAGGILQERWQGHCFRIASAAESESFSIEAPSTAQVVESYWFAWAAFCPDTSVAGEAWRRD